MPQERTFSIPLKNNQTVELKFSSIIATNDQLWQMFATTEALDVLEKIISQANPEATNSARKVAPKKKK
jgi:hypothetical protein